MSANAMLQALNVLYDHDDLRRVMDHINNLGNNND